MVILNGIDIVDNKRIVKLIAKKNNAVHDIFSTVEIEYCFSKKKPEQSLGARFAAKEALLKAIDGHILAYDLRDIEVFNHSSGKPALRIKSQEIENKIKKILKQTSYQISLSLSHEKNYSIANVIVY